MYTSPQVAVRILPLQPDDPSFNQDLISYKENTIKLSNNQNKLEKQFNKVFGPFTPQEDIFNFICPLITSYDKGISSTILIYGQEGSGKKFTMFGNSKNYGILPRIIYHIFRVLSSDYIVRFSMIQIYKEVIYDLLNWNEDLTIKQYADYGIYIHGLTEYIIKSPDEALKLIDKAKIIYDLESAELSSSISEFIIINQINISSTSPNENGLFYKSKIMIIYKLAGKKKVESYEKFGYNFLFREPKINRIKTLENSVYGLVIKGNLDVGDSKLTHLLKESLEGQHKLILIATLNPRKENFYESFDIMKFANIFKQIKVKTRIQEITLRKYQDIEKFERENKIIKIYKENAEEYDNDIRIHRKGFKDNQNLNYRKRYKNIEKISEENIILKNINSIEYIVGAANYKFSFTENKNYYKKSKSCRIAYRHNADKISFKKRYKSSTK
ncbi:hypothetical protein SteCoe_6861 [Stentor coeruleus]|uniref:Kinesin motor domain-containing protein n=1 Tax=Stentor coeruleus TaxID=5963 RepID=A0A1R2CNU7_9CILI|nr:hypothetical protein SteCoe_6861 [Stentor coeruleus]